MSQVQHLFSSLNLLESYLHMPSSQLLDKSFIVKQNKPPQTQCN